MLTLNSVSEEDRAAQMEQFLNEEELATRVRMTTNKEFVSTFLRCSSHLCLSG